MPSLVGSEMCIRDRKKTFTKNVLTNLGNFGSLYDISDIKRNYNHPVLVQSVDGVGTKTIIARKLKKFDTIGIDLLSACSNDIIVMGAKPLTFLDYIANDKLDPLIIKEIVSGMVKACKENGVSLVGGETAEMPDTYHKGEHDLVGIITGIVEKDNIITGDNIKEGNILLGIESNGLHTNGYSLARKLFFDIGKFKVKDKIPEFEKNIGLTLLEPHINYTKHVFSLMDNKIDIRGIAHITGGGLIENIPRILPDKFGVEIYKNSWFPLPVFNVMRDLGKLSEIEMFRTFNMGIGLVIIIDENDKKKVMDLLSDFSKVFEIGIVNNNKNKVVLI